MYIQCMYVDNFYVYFPSSKLRGNLQENKITETSPQITGYLSTNPLINEWVRKVCYYNPQNWTKYMYVSLALKEIFTLLT